MIAHEAGLETTSRSLLGAPDRTGRTAAAFLNGRRVRGREAALDGARQILIERSRKTRRCVGELRDAWMWGALKSSVAKDLKPEQQAEAAPSYPTTSTSRQAHSPRAVHRRAGAAARTRAHSSTSRSIQPAAVEKRQAGQAIVAAFNISNKNRAADKWLADTVRLAWRARCCAVEVDTVDQLRGRRGRAIRVFGLNLRDLLLAARAGGARPWASIRACARA